MLLSHILLLCLINSSLTLEINSDIDNESFKNGLITEDRGKLVIYNSHYFFPLQLFYKDVIGHYESLHTQFRELYTLIDNQERLNITDSVIDLLTEELSQWKHQYFDSLELIRDMFKWSLNSNQSFELTRHKRGLFNFGGEALKFLIGTAQDSEVQSISDSVNKLMGKFKTHDLAINLHNKILKINTIKMHRINEVQKKLVNLVNDLADKFDSFENFTQIIEKQMLNSNAFSSLILALMSLNTQTLIIKSGIEEMMSGKLSPNIIDPNTLKSYLLTIKNEGHSILLEDSDLSFYYNIAQVDATYHAESKSILFLISFPINFVSIKPFNLMKVTALPIKSSKFPHIFTKYRVKRYVAINALDQYFESDDLSTCKIVKNIHICPLATSLNKNQKESCALSLLNNIPIEDRICNTELLRLSQPQFSLSKGLWYYATPFPIELAIHCHSKYWNSWKIEKNETLQASGRIKIGLGCVGISEYIHLMPTAINIWAKGRNMSFKQEILPQLEINKKLEHLPSVRKINISKIMSNSNKQNLQQLSTQLMLLEGIDSNYKEKLTYFSEWTYGATFLSLIALSFTILLLSMMIWEFTMELGRTLEADDTNDMDAYTLNHSVPSSSIQFTSNDIKEAYLISPFKTPLYENQEVTLVKAKNSSTGSLYVNMDKSDNLVREQELKYKETLV